MGRKLLFVALGEILNLWRVVTGLRNSESFVWVLGFFFSLFDFDALRIIWSKFLIMKEMRKLKIFWTF